MANAQIERHSLSDGLAVLVGALLAIVGLAFGLNSPDAAMSFHGFVFAALAVVAALYVMVGRERIAPTPIPGGDHDYMDGPIRFATLAAIVWGIAGFLVGDIIAWQLAYPVLNLDMPWTSFGRLRPLHTSAVIFAFGGNVLLATSLYVVQRTSHARLAGRWAPWFVVYGYNVFIVLAGTGYLFGITQSKEYAEPEWYADLWLTIVWVVYLLVFLGTLMKRREPHIYVANWFYLAFIVTIAMLHIINNVAIPVSLLGSKSYVIYSGVQDAMTQWWYGHNAVAFFLTLIFKCLLNNCNLLSFTLTS